MPERLTQSLQESVLTLLAMSDKEGHIAAGLLKADHFEEPYFDIAQRVLAYHKEHGKAPGASHVDDLVDEIVGNPKHPKHKQTVFVLEALVRAAEGLNAGYVLRRVDRFTRRQSIKSAVIEAADTLQAGGDDDLEKAETVLTQAIKFRDDSMDMGVRLSDKKRALKFLIDPPKAIKTGIRELDERGVGPTAGEMFLFMAPKGAGKSWLGVHLGKSALMQGLRVCHISLEMGEERVVPRYYQSIFGIPKRRTPYDLTRLIIDSDMKQLDEIVRRKKQPRVSMNDPDIAAYLSEKIDDWGVRFNRLVIKGFPAKSLTTAKLGAYLDMLETTDGFIPNLLILDYPDLMFMDRKNPRLSLGWTFEEVRGLLQARNIAGYCPTQSNRSSWDAATVKASMIAEDASKMNTADQAVIFSQTEAEKQLGLARLLVEKNRNDEDKFRVIISQDYRSGIFALDSVRMKGEQKYFDMIAAEAGLPQPSAKPRERYRRAGR